MDRVKRQAPGAGKRKLHFTEKPGLETSNLSQDHMSTAHSEMSSTSTDYGSFFDVSMDPAKFFPTSKTTSKSLQQLIARSRPEELSKIIEIISPRISDLMIDLYGNYMCQTLFHNCSAGQRLLLLKAMRGSLLSVAFHPRGTHALQNLIAMSSLKEEENIYREEFQSKFVEMSKNDNASHVVQRLLSTLNNRYFIIREFIGRVDDLAIDKLGVCVVKKCCNDPQIMNEVLASCLLLIQHPYGNYAVQSVLEMWKEEVSHEFVSSVSGKVPQLCLQKYASNVMEKAIKIESIRSSIIKELVNEEKILELVGNQYGCYVLRTLAKDCDRACKDLIYIYLKSSVQKVHSQKLKPLWQDITDILTIQ